MVFQDYELVQTKRVTRQRYNTNIYVRRTFHAIGGYSTLYMMGLGYFTGKALGLGSNVKPIVTPLVSRAGVKGLAINAFFICGPALFGLHSGILCFGNPSELDSLLSHPFRYYHEFKSLQQELVGRD